MNDILNFPSSQRRQPTKDRYKKSDNIKKLELDYLTHKQAKFIGQPYISKKSFEDKTANGLTKCLQYWCLLNGAHFQRMNTQGQYDAKLKRYRRSGATKGVTDTLIIYKGKTLNIEIKINKDKQSKEQKDIQLSIEKAGGNYWIIKTFDEFINKIIIIKK